jgi:hypothetical protein
MKRIIRTLVIVFLMVVNLGLVINLSGQNLDKLPRSTPESQGVSSTGIADFLNAVDTGRKDVRCTLTVHENR